ncbi:helix-turn-helix domain protein (plasmid) [Leptolyngbya boryana NIES-2135]|uniref:Helix-turn-helix domain protein n=3 Tax=Leptolyngbya group TaxID=3081713 RepID=A0A1Z4JSU7_LEPBY|nr:MULTISPECIES: helix-turn-helix transcriptional regulator [Leptolyngbya]ULP33611.1 helix-turn-helix domain-containing protein [Leptolyngbya boryana IU 594]BAY59792.1 helix-turn-helix domain protein [Leptolyngbya boryana NIES-2135]
MAYPMNLPVSASTFAEWLHFQRHKKGIRQKELAKALNISHKTVSAWETGYSIPKLNPEQTKILCEMLECSFEELAEAFAQSQAIERVAS